MQKKKKKKIRTAEFLHLSEMTPTALSWYHASGSSLGKVGQKKLNSTLLLLQDLRGKMQNGYELLQYKVE